MISAVSNVSFRGEADAKDINSLINSPGKFSAAQAAPQGPEADVVDLSTAPKEKSNTGLIIGGTLGALALAWIGLGVAVNKGKLTKVEVPAGWGDNIKNFFHTVGKSADDAYSNTLGKWFGKKDAEVPKTDGAEGAGK